jgi:hypothetical protein
MPDDQFVFSFKNLKIKLYKTITYLLVLYWCQIRSLTLGEEHRLAVFENRVQRRTFVWKRDEVTGGCRKLHNEEFHNLYSSLNIIRMIKSRRMRWVGHVARMGTTGNAYRIFVGKPERKRPLGRPRRMWEDNKMVLREIELGGMDWIDLAQDRDQWRAVVNTVMNLRDP